MAKPLRLLSLDGGGVKGISILMILQRIFRVIEEKTGTAPKPCEYFDLIGGTSTGGVIAILLGRLKMTIEESITAYQAFGEKVFKKQSNIYPVKAIKAAAGRPWCDANVLEAAIRDLLVDINMDADKMFREDFDPECKVFVCVTRAENGQAELLRSYQTRDPGQHDYPCSILEAARATTAAPLFFPKVSLKLDGSTFVDGGLRRNNPIYEMVREAKRIWADLAVGCLVSIGTGWPNTVSLKSSKALSVVQACVDIAFDAQSVAEDFLADDLGTRLWENKKYFRFNVEQGLQDVQLDEYKKMEIMRAMTNSYLSRKDKAEMVRECARNLLNLGAESVGPAIGGDSSLIGDQATRLRRDRKDILKLLPHANNAEFDRGVNFLTGTRVQMFKEIDEWLLSPDGNILWIHAPAGSGKSTIACELARRLEMDGSGRLGATFFCRINDALTQDPNFIFPTIAFQLAYSRPSFMDCIAAVLRNEPHVGRQSVDNQFARLIREPLKSVGQVGSETVVVIIDAIDDCGDVESRQPLLNCLERELKMPTLPKWFKLLITSRPMHDIRLALRGAIKLPIDLDSDTNLTDLHMFIEDRMHDLVDVFDPDLPSGWPGRERINEIGNLAQGLFQWVHHLYNFIRYSTDQDQSLDLVLSSDFSGGPTERLYTLYTKTFNHIAKDEPRAFFEDYRLYVGRILAAKAPLTSSDFSSIFQGSKKLVLANIVWRFGSVLYTDRKGAIRVVHQSLVDFLTSSTLCKDPRFYINMEIYDTAFAHACLQNLTHALKFNICNLPNTHQLLSEVEEFASRLDTHIPPYVRYCCQFWAAHLHTVSKDHAEIHVATKDFFDKRIFYWLEVLCLLGDLEGAMASLRDVQKWVKPEDKFQRMIDDIHGFIIRFYPLISQCPMHIYLSALPFLPKGDAKTLDSWRNRLPRIPTTTTGSDSVWGKLLYAASGHNAEITGLAFAGNGRRLVSCSEDKTVRVWDAETGEEVLGPLKGHSERLSWVAVTPDAKRLASVSNDRTVRIWDGETGAALFDPLEGHTKWVSTVAFSPCGTLLVTGSFDTTLRIWEPDKNKVIVLQGHIAPVNHVAFSSDSKRVVSGAFDKCVRVWDADSGSPILGPLEGHTHWVRTVSFSPDNARIASGSSDWSIRIWCATQGTQLLVLQGHSHWVLSVAFSPNGKRLVSGSYDMTIRVWNMDSGCEELTPLEGHSASVKAVAFTPRGDRILSAATDMTQQIWNAHTGKLTPKVVKPTTHFVCAAAIAGDKYIAFAFTDGTVQVWDCVSLTTHLCRSNDQIFPVTSIAFSTTAEFLYFRIASAPARVIDLSSVKNVAAGASLSSVPANGHDLSPLNDVSQPFRLDTSSGWVLDTEDRRTIWIPIYHRDCILASSASGSIILRNKSGKVTVISGVKSPTEAELPLMTQAVQKIDGCQEQTLR